MARLRHARSVQKRSPPRMPPPEEVPSTESDPLLSIEESDPLLSIEESNPATKKQGRGLTRPKPVVREEDRIPIRPYGNSSFVPSAGVSTTISYIVRQHLPKNVWRYSQYPEHIKHLCYEDFLKRFKLLSGQDNARAVFDYMAADAFSRAMRTIRYSHTKKHKEDYVKWKSDVPVSIPAPCWPALCDHWSTPEYKKICEQAKKNRGNVPGHVAGTANVGTHELRLEKQLGRPPTALELFNVLHTRSGEFVTEKASSASALISLALTQEYGEDHSNHPTRDESLIVKALGPNRHGRIYGWGRSVSTRALKGGTSSGNSFPTNTESEEENLDIFEERLNKVLSRRGGSVSTLAQKGGTSSGNSFPTNTVSEEENLDIFEERLKKVLSKWRGQAPPSCATSEIIPESNEVNIGDTEICGG